MLKSQNNIPKWEFSFRFAIGIPIGMDNGWQRL